MMQGMYCQEVEENGLCGGKDKDRNRIVDHITCQLVVECMCYGHPSANYASYQATFVCRGIQERPLYTLQRVL